MVLLENKQNILEGLKIDSIRVIAILLIFLVIQNENVKSYFFKKTF